MVQKILIEIQQESEFSPLPSDNAIITWAQTALQDRVPEGTELCIRLVDKPEIQTLNREYRHKDKPTNVLSFPIDLPEEVDVPLLGDIVICAPIVFEEAQAQNKTYEAHFAHMIVHGCLHLLGYDHETDEQANQMEPLEIDILALINIPNPYSREKS
jgi:probable rRNA maturation factor